MFSNNTFVYLAGDFNARNPDGYFDELSDIYLISQPHLNKYITLENLSVQLNIVSRDHRMNAHCVGLIEVCSNHNLFILNGRMGKDKNLGRYIFIGENLLLTM